MLPVLLVVAQALPYAYYLTGDAADSKATPRPGYVLAGGGGDQDDAMKWFLARSGGGDVVVLRASGADGYNKYLFELGKVDSVESIVFLSAEASVHPFVIERIQNAEAIFFAGGDQWKYVDYWRGTLVEAAVQEAIGRGVPVGGSSAGLAILGEWSFSAKFDTVKSDEALADPFHRAVQLERDFLKLPSLRGVITDSHFAERSRQGRMLVFLARMALAGIDEPRGIGVDERTAVLVEADGSARVVGKGEAWFYHAPGRAEVCEPGKALEYRGVQVERVKAGGGFDLSMWKAGR